MSSRPSFTGKDILAALTKKGFEESMTHHRQLYLKVDGKRTGIRTHISHGKKLYEGDLWSALRKQLGLQDDGAACVDLISCTLDHPGYVAKLKAKKLI
jgi:predicted RNA binding protein YcfA (HicA-like mRNA interferase family)